MTIYTLMLFVKDSKDYRCCVVSMFLRGGRGYDQIAEITVPTMMRYALRVNADFHMIQRRELAGVETWFQAVWEKLQMRHLFDVYDRLLFVDLDCYITKKCSNVFQDFPYETFAGVHYPRGLAEEFPRYVDFMGRGNGLDGNSGVMLIDKPFRQYLEPPDNWREQSENFKTSAQMWIFSNMFWNGVKVSQLPYHYHKMDNFQGEGIFHMVNCGMREQNKIDVLKMLKSQNS